MPIAYPTATPGASGSSGVGAAAYNYAPPTVSSNIGNPIDWRNADTGQVVPAGAPGAKATVLNPTVGQFGTNQTFGQSVQQQNQRYSLANDVNYGDYERLGTQAQGYGQYAQNTLSDPRVAAAMQAQSTQAAAPSAAQNGATSQQRNALDMLGNAAAGNGPTAADIQGQRSISEAMRAQLAAGASARGGAYAQAAAQTQAAQQAAGIQAQGVGQAAALRAQEQQNAQSAYAGAAGQAVSGANQAYGLQTQALGNAQQAAAAQQGLAMNYYTGQQGALQSQSQFAGQLASNQVANDYGLAGTAMQTQTQQRIADQQQGTQIAGATAGAVGGLLMALASTGGAEAAARGALDQGVPMRVAANIGEQVGQDIGRARVGPELAQAARPADAEAALRGAMSVDDVHAHLAALRGRSLPGPSTEPMAPQAYAAGSHLAALARQVRGA